MPMAGGTLYSVALGDVRGESADAALSNVPSLYQGGLTASAPLCWTSGASWDLVRAGVPFESPLKALWEQGKALFANAPRCERGPSAGRVLAP